MLHQFHAFHQLEDSIKRYERGNLGSRASTSNVLLDSSEAKNDNYSIKIGVRQGLLAHKDNNQKVFMRGPPALQWAKDNIRGIKHAGKQALKLDNFIHLVPVQTFSKN